MVTLEDINHYLKHERNLGPITKEYLTISINKVKNGEKMYFSERHTIATILQYMQDGIQ